MTTSKVMRQTASAISCLLGIGSASAGLIDRGGGVIYDTTLNITWVSDASLCVALGNCVNRNDSVVNGGMAWSDASTWAANLDYGGYSDWRLATMNLTSPTPYGAWLPDCNVISAADCAANRNELGYMYFITLAARYSDNYSKDRTGNQIVDGVLLTNIQQAYWSATESMNYENNSTYAWFLNFNNTSLSFDGKSVPLGAWAVRDGDVATVPEPSSLALLGLGLAGLGVIRRKRA